MIPSLTALWLTAAAALASPPAHVVDRSGPAGEPARESIVRGTEAKESGSAAPDAKEPGTRPPPGEPGSPAADAARPPTHAPEFSLEGLNGDPVDSLYAARPVTIVHFWASWCVPCMREVPHLNGLAARYEAAGMGLFAVSADDASLNELRQLARSYGMRYTILKADPDVVNGFGGFESFPTTFLVDRKGLIVAKHVGAGEEVQKKIEASVRTLLQGAGRRLPDPSR